jgi:hypothetical protein
VECAPDGLVPSVVEHEIGMPTRPSEPLLYAMLPLLECVAHRELRRRTVGICRRRRNVLLRQPLAEFIVAAPDVSAQGVATGALVRGKVVCCPTGFRVRRPFCL